MNLRVKPSINGRVDLAWNATTHDSDVTRVSLIDSEEAIRWDFSLCGLHFII